MTDEVLLTEDSKNLEKTWKETKGSLSKEDDRSPNSSLDIGRKNIPLLTTPGEDSEPTTPVGINNVLEEGSLNNLLKEKLLISPRRPKDVLESPLLNTRVKNFSSNVSPGNTPTKRPILNTPTKSSLNKSPLTTPDQSPLNTPTRTPSRNSNAPSIQTCKKYARNYTAAERVQHEQEIMLLKQRVTRIEQKYANSVIKLNIDNAENLKRVHKEYADKLEAQSKCLNAKFANQTRLDEVALKEKRATDCEELRNIIKAKDKEVEQLNEDVISLERQLSGANDYIHKILTSFQTYVDSSKGLRKGADCSLKELLPS